MTIALDAQHKRWIEGYAAKAHRRLLAAGCSTLQMDDVRQECWIAWCKARDTYRDDMGASFGTYLYRGMELHLKRWRTKQMTVAWNTAMGDDAIAVAESVMGDEDVESDFERRQTRESVLRRMSKLARPVVALLAEPPAWLLTEFKAMRAKTEWSRSRGFHPQEISIFTLTCQALGLSDVERKRVAQEMRRFASRGT